MFGTVSALITYFKGTSVGLLSSLHRRVFYGQQNNSFSVRSSIPRELFAPRFFTVAGSNPLIRECAQCIAQSYNLNTCVPSDRLRAGTCINYMWYLPQMMMTYRDNHLPTCYAGGKKAPQRTQFTAHHITHQYIHHFLTGPGLWLNNAATDQCMYGSVGITRNAI